MPIDSAPCFSEAYVEPYKLEWSRMQRVRFFIMGALQPAICVAYPLISLGPLRIRNIVDELIDLDELGKSRRLARLRHMWLMPDFWGLENDELEMSSEIGLTFWTDVSVHPFNRNGLYS